MATRRRVDDSEEEEATAIDLRQSAKSVAPSPSSAGSPSSALPRKAPSPAAPRAKAPIIDDDDDEDATEFLQVRPGVGGMPASTPTTAPPKLGSPSVEPGPRARGRAVPLGGEASEPSQAPSAPLPPLQPLPPTSPMSPLPSAPAQRPARETTEPFIDTGNRARPLPGTRFPPIGDQSTTGSHAGTASVPRITRIHVTDSTSAPDMPDPESTLPPSGPESKRVAAAAAAAAANHLKNEFERRPSTLVQNLNDETQASDGDATQAPSSTTTGEIKAAPPRPVPKAADVTNSDEHDGVLVVEAPGDAIVVVNGVDRGRGVVRVTDLDRSAKHAVRIHAPGFQPWSGSVTLEGKPAAKIRPTLKPRR